MKASNLVSPFGIDFDLAAGVMKCPDKHLVRRASDMRGYYSDAEALEGIIQSGDPLHYETFEKELPEEYGHLLFCISKLEPGSVGGECFMTKGHYHTVIETAEIYLCLRGEGYMVMKTTDGEFAAERMQPGRMVYVPPCWAHRSVNTGDESLISLCIYPAEAGHNYGDIESEGFPKRVVKTGGQVTMVDATPERQSR